MTFVSSKVWLCSSGRIFKIVFLFSIPTDVVSCKHWLASGSNESVIHVHDLNSMLGTNVFPSSHGNSWKAFSVLCVIVILHVLRVFSLRK